MPSNSLEVGADRDNKIIVEHYRQFPIFALSFYAAVLLAFVPKRESVSQGGLKIIQGTCFFGATASIGTFYVGYSLPSSGTNISQTMRRLVIILYNVCAVILAATPCLLLFLAQKFLAAVSLALAVIFTIVIWVYVDDTILSRGTGSQHTLEPELLNGTGSQLTLEPELLNGAYCNTILAIGGITGSILCSSMMNISSKDTSLEIELASCLFFFAVGFGLTSIVNVLAPLTLYSTTPSTDTLIRTMTFSTLSAILLFCSVCTFASKFLGSKLYLLIIPLPTFVLESCNKLYAHWMAGATTTTTTTQDDNSRMWKALNAFALLDFGVLMVVLETQVESQTTFGKPFEMFVLFSLMVFFRLEVQIVVELWRSSDLLRGYVVTDHQTFNGFMCLLQTAALCSLFLFYVL